MIIYFKYKEIKMAKKKSGGIDKTQLWVAIIGVIGTIAVTLITTYAGKNGNKTPAPTEIPAASSTDTPSAPQSGGLCLEDYFSNVSAENRHDLQVGETANLSAKKDAVYGVRLFEGTGLLGEILFTGTSNTKSFNIVSIIDATCSQVFGFENLDSPGSNNAIGNSENLGATFFGADYRLRMEWTSGNQIELKLSRK